MKRRLFIQDIGLIGLSFLFNPNKLAASLSTPFILSRIKLTKPNTGEDVFTYIKRIKGNFDLVFYRQILGAANRFKEGDEIAGLAAENDQTRNIAIQLIGNTKLIDVMNHPVFQDQLYELIIATTAKDNQVSSWTFAALKDFLLNSSNEEIEKILPFLTSDCIATVVKLMDNESLIQVSSKVFNPLPGSKIGSKGYMGARVQPNSPTDHPEDVFWQVMSAWSYGVGDVVLGTNPVSSDPEKVAMLEKTLYDLIATFNLQDILPHCVLSHIDIQAEVEKKYPGTTGIWFQSLAGTVNANKTFDLTVEKMQQHAKQRTGKYGLYAETGQGADETNGHGEGFDMLYHESRKYGFHRALKIQINQQVSTSLKPWVFVNDVAGFIGPEVFRTKEQLVRCCLEDLVMGKLHGLTIGLDICTTLHMDVSLDDLSWCIQEIMPANPAYLMALPTRNDPMLSYLTTSFSDHVQIREKFGYKVNDEMWAFFKRVGIIDSIGNPSQHFADPTWIYLQYMRAKGDLRSEQEIIEEGLIAIKRVRARGVPIAMGHGTHYSEPEPELDQYIRRLYDDAKFCIWQDWKQKDLSAFKPSVLLSSKAIDRRDYVYHPSAGETLNDISVRSLELYRKKIIQNIPDILLVVSDGLNVLSLTDPGHLNRFLELFKLEIKQTGYQLNDSTILIRQGRVRVGYRIGENIFGGLDIAQKKYALVHLIGERPGTEHRNFSIYITVAHQNKWAVKGAIDHDVTQVVSGISDTALKPEEAVQEVIQILKKQFL